MEKKKIEIVEQENVDKFSAGAAKVMEAIGHPEALVTDLSQVFDFISWFPDQMLTESQKLEFQQEEAETLKRLGDLLGREVKGTEHIWQLAKEAENRQFFTELEESVKLHQEELANNPELRKEEEEEQRLWDNTLMDGLEDE